MATLQNNWDPKTQTSEIGNYVYGLAIPAFGSTYLVKYVGQASNGNNRCFQHQIEAQKYLQGQGTSNAAKVDMINYFASHGDYVIIILARKIDPDLLDTMENLYAKLADSGSLLFTIDDDRIVDSNNLTNIANTHNSKQPQLKKMVVKPMTVKQIEEAYGTKKFLSSSEISQALGTNKKVLYVINRPGTKAGYFGWWGFGKRSLKSTDWIVFIGSNNVITHVFNVNGIKPMTQGQVNPKLQGTPAGNKFGFNVTSLTNHLNKLTTLPACQNKIPSFDCSGKGFQKGFRYL